MQLLRKYCQGLAVLLVLILVQGLIPVSAFASEEGGFSAESLTIQPGETEESVKLTWYAPAGDIGENTAGVSIHDAQGQALGASPAVIVTEPHIPTGMDRQSNPYHEYKVCKATVTGLQPGTTYTYRITNDGEVYSKEYQYTTPAAGRFTFAFTSDPQIKESGETNNKGWNPSDGKNQTGWAKMLEVVSQQGATLMVSAGDQVEDQS